MNPMNLLYKTCPPARQSGLSLVELMISLAIGLVLLLGLSTLLVQQNSSRSEMEKSGRQIENGRYAMQLLHDDIQLAGFYSGYSPASGVVTAIPPDDPCDTTTANLGWNAATPRVPVPIFGYADATAPNFPTCLNNYQANSAVLVIRRTSTATPTPAASAVANVTYLQVSNCTTQTTPFVLETSGFTLFQRNCATLATLRPYIVRIYYVSSCSVCGSDTIPTLKMVDFVGGRQTIVPLVEGIQSMALDYGIDDTGDGAPDRYIPADTTTAADWPNVMAVRVNLLARNNEPTTGYVDTKTYNMLGGTGTIGPFDDAFKRHAYSQLVRVTNPSGRRE